MDKGSKCFLPYIQNSKIFFMLLFKTAGDTINSVVSNQRHAFLRIPKDWYKREIILISKNRKDCRKDEKQIQHIMYLDEMRPTSHQEIEKYWPNNFGRWKYIAICSKSTKLQKPFDLDDIIEYNKLLPYKNITPAMKIHSEHEDTIFNHLRSINACLLNSSYPLTFTS